MECSTGSGFVFDLGALYAHFRTLRDHRKPRGLRYRSYWRIENGLHDRRDVTLQEDRTRLTRGQAGQIMAGLNNLVLGILDQRAEFPYVPAARSYFAAFPKKALALVTRL
jgi:hypothetical protein